MNCLDNIIGLSETTCTCFEPLPAGYNTSASGIFLDRLQGLELETLKAADDCARGGLWDRMFQAVADSKKQFIADMLGCVAHNYKSKRDVFAGLLGQTTFQSSLALTTNYAGVKGRMQNIKGAFLNVKQIGVLINATAPVTVEVWSNENDGTLVDSFTINAVANTLTYGAISPDPLTLPMWSNNRSNLNYYFIYQLDGSFQPLNNKKDCGCGNVDKSYLEWIDYIGVKGASTSAVDSFTDTQKEMNGLVLDVEMKCKTSEIICSDERPLDFEDDGFAMNMAYAIRFKAGEILIDSILSSVNINRFTLMNREALYGKRNHYRVEYEKWVAFMCENPNIEYNDCLECRQGHFIKSGIRAT